MKASIYRFWIIFLSFLSAADLFACCFFCIFSYQDAPAIQAFVSPEVQNEFVGTAKHTSYYDLIRSLSDLKARYPLLTKLETVGTSAKGRSLLLLRLGNGPKKAIIIGAIHAREHLATKYLLCCMEDYCRAYESESGLLGDYNIKKLLTEYTLYILPCANPDGLELLFGSEKADADVEITKLSDYKANARGVDLNRNFPIAWSAVDNGIKKPFQCYYKGPFAGSEPETKAIMKLCATNSFDFAISFHVKGSCIFWGDEYKTANNALYLAFAEKIAQKTDLSITKPTKHASDYGGGFENWFRHTYSKPGLCIELVSADYKLSPIGNKDYVNFYHLVRYEKTKFALAAAMS